jgi:hypothetical protein
MMLTVPMSSALKLKIWGHSVCFQGMVLKELDDFIISLLLHIFK